MLSSCSSVAARSPARLADRYELLDPLGAGGMGIVHAARDQRTGRVVAIKRPWAGVPGSSSCPGFDPRESLVRESVALGRLDHPNIVHLWDAGTDEAGEPFMVLELVEQPLSIVSWAAAATPFERLLALGQMFEALAHVHAAGLVHGDVKPSNVLLAGRTAAPSAARCQGLRVCLVDFGLVGGIDDSPSAGDCGSPAALVGSVLYFAPERIDGARPSAASDVYAAGIVAVEVLTGVDPSRGARPGSTLIALRDFGAEWAARTAGTGGLGIGAADLLARLLARDSAARFSASAAASGLADIARELACARDGRDLDGRPMRRE